MNHNKWIGILIIALSVYLYLYTAPAFLLVTIAGWTSDAPTQPFLDALYVRFFNGILFASNVSLTYGGKYLFVGRKNERATYMLLIFGAIAPLYIFRLP